MFDVDVVIVDGCVLKDVLWVYLFQFRDKLFIVGIIFVMVLIMIVVVVCLFGCVFFVWWFGFDDGFVVVLLVCILFDFLICFF